MPACPDRQLPVLNLCNSSILNNIFTIAEPWTRTYAVRSQIDLSTLWTTTGNQAQHIEIDPTPDKTVGVVMPGLIRVLDSIISQVVQALTNSTPKELESKNIDPLAMQGPEGVPTPGPASGELRCLCINRGSALPHLIQIDVTALLIAES